MPRTKKELGDLTELHPKEDLPKALAELIAARVVHEVRIKGVVFYERICSLPPALVPAFSERLLARMRQDGGAWGEPMLAKVCAQWSLHPFDAHCLLVRLFFMGLVDRLGPTQWRVAAHPPPVVPDEDCFPLHPIREPEWINERVAQANIRPPPPPPPRKPSTKAARELAPELKDSSHEGTLCRRLVAVLAKAREPLMFDDLRALLPDSAYDLTHELRLCVQAGRIVEVSIDLYALPDERQAAA